MGQERKSFLNLAGEFAVASELNRRGVHAAVTYGTSKRADIFAMADSRDRVVRIEVKCSGQRKWLIGTRGASPPTQESSRVRWYRLAAAQGLADAQVNLGVMYDNGLGVPQDDVQAHMWFNLAALRRTGEARERAVQGRDAAAARMTPAQIAEAQRLARA